MLLLPPGPTRTCLLLPARSSSPRPVLTSRAISRIVGVVLLIHGHVYVIRVDAQAAEQNSREHGHFLVGGWGWGKDGGKENDCVLFAIFGRFDSMWLWLAPPSACPPQMGGSVGGKTC